MKMMPGATLLAMLGVLAGCATPPPVDLRYLPATWAITVEVTRLIGCNDDKTLLVHADALAITPVYRAVPGADPFVVSLPAFGHGVANTKFEMNLSPDGRLLGINGESTGQGLQLAQSLGGLLATVKPLLAEDAKMRTPEGKLPECGAVAGLVAANRFVTLRYRYLLTPEELSKASGGIHLVADIQEVHERLQKALPAPKVFAKVLSTEQKAGPALARTGSGDYVGLTLQRTEVLGVQVRRDNAPEESAWLQVPVPKISAEGKVGREHTQVVPLPRAALFGASGFKLVLHESGAVTTASFNTTQGASDSASALAALLKPFTTASELERRKAEADLLAQLNRIVVCQTSPKDCK